MALSTYAELQESIASWLNRSDLDDQIPDFITLAEAAISRKLLKDGPVRRMMTRLTISVDAEFENVPSDFMGVKAIYLTEDRTKPLEFCEPEKINDLKAIVGTNSGKPTHFSVVGGQIQYFPAPSQAYAGELTYWARIPALSNSNTSNWLLSINPDVYLYSSLIAASPFLHDDARALVWGTLANAAIAEIIFADKVERQSTNLFVPYVASGTP